MLLHFDTINRQIVLTVITLIFTVVFFDLTGLDIWVQDYFYNVATHHWIIDRDNQVLKFVFYSGIKKLFIVFVLSLVVALVFFRKSEWVKKYKKGLLVVCISAAAVTLTIGGLKTHTNVPCPKNIKHFGGTFPYVTILGTYPDYFQQTEKMECYPAGHAGGGFALLSLFFLFKRRRNKIIALVSVMALGWTIGLYKMLIGDHFLSHTVVSMLLAWLIVLIVTKVVYKTNKLPALKEPDP